MDFPSCVRSNFYIILESAIFQHVGRTPKNEVMWCKKMFYRDHNFEIAARKILNARSMC